jgi:hypothetical protein
MSRRGSIGFDRRLDLSWLDAAAAKAKAGAGSEELRAALWDLAGDPANAGHGVSARKKTVTVLHRIWGPDSGSTEHLRQRAMLLLEDCGPEERLGLHWAMMLARYPVFTDVASTVGRLLMLQDSVTLSLLSRRLADSWGSRSTVDRAVQRIVRSMIQWGVLEDTALAGEYRAQEQRIHLSPEIGAVIAEALLQDAEGNAMALGVLISHPALFPFDVRAGAASLRNARQFRIHREGLDTDVVELVQGS